MTEALIGLNKKMLKFLQDKNCLPTITYEPTERAPTGSLALDYIMGGGLALNKLMIVTGDPGAGKTTTMTMISAYISTHPEEYEHEGMVAFFDMERTFDPQWALKLGADPTRLHLYKPESGEVMMDMIGEFLKEKVYDMIVVDSVNTTAFNAELEGSADDNYVGVAARKWSQFFRQNTHRLSVSGTALVTINQLKFSIGKFNPTGQPDSIYGGRAFEFNPSVWTHLLSAKRSKDESVITMRFKNRKNKTAQAFREIEVELHKHPDEPLFVNYVPELTAVGAAVGVLTGEDGKPKSGNGAWYFKGEKIAGARESTEAALAEDTDAAEELRNQIEDAIRVKMAALNRFSVASLPEMDNEPVEEQDEAAVAESE